MTVFVVASPENKLDKKGRASGWRNVPLDHKSKSCWKSVLEQVKGKGVQHVFASDLDGEAAHVAGNELRVPVRLDFGYRRFNCGRHHAAPLTRVDEILGELEHKWKSNPAIPIKGGDSLLSYEKRFVKKFNRLLEGEGSVLFITDARSIHMIRGQFNPHALVPNGNPVKLDKVYKVKKEGT